MRVSFGAFVSQDCGVKDFYAVNFRQYLAAFPNFRPQDTMVLLNKHYITTKQTSEQKWLVKSKVLTEFEG